MNPCCNNFDKSDTIYRCHSCKKFYCINCSNKINNKLCNKCTSCKLCNLSNLNLNACIKCNKAYCDNCKSDKLEKICKNCTEYKQCRVCDNMIIRYDLLVCNKYSCLYCKNCGEYNYCFKCCRCEKITTFIKNEKYFEDHKYILKIVVEYNYKGEIDEDSIKLEIIESYDIKKHLKKDLINLADQDFVKFYKYQSGMVQNDNDEIEYKKYRDLEHILTIKRHNNMNLCDFKCKGDNLHYELIIDYEKSKFFI